MALSLVISETDSDLRSILENILKNRLDQPEDECKRIPSADHIHPSHRESSSGSSSLSSSIQASSPKFSPTNSEFGTRIENITPDSGYSSSRGSEKSEQGRTSPRIMYEGRDILNLGANLREPSWLSWSQRKIVLCKECGPTTIPHAIYCCPNRRNLLQRDQPVRICEFCQFPDPQN